MCGTYRDWDDLVFNGRDHSLIFLMCLCKDEIYFSRIGSVPSCSQAALLCLKNGLIVIIDF